MYRIVLATVLLFGCVTEDDGSPTEDDIAQVDQWADASGGKADLPATWSGVVSWVKDFYRNRLSAVWSNQEHPASSAAAIARIRGLIGADPSRTLFRATVQRLRFSDVADHSEVDIVLPSKQVVRLIGDPKGAGMFLDTKPFETTLSPALCLTWNEVQTAVTTAYAQGAYGADFVCHNITERVLRALHVGSAPYAAQIHAYSIARYLWGPILPSGNSSNPASWDESRACP